MGADVQTTSKQKNRWRWINPVVRIGATLQVAVVVVQASLAGLSLTGSREALEWHQRIGVEGITSFALIVLLLAVLNWRPGHGPAWPALVALVAMLALFLQIETGFARTQGVHLPTGVLIFGANLVIALRVRPSRAA